MVKSPHLCVDSVKKRSSEGLEVARMELEEREKVREELHGVQLWLEAADVLLNEMEQGRSAQELQVRRSSPGPLVSVEIAIFRAFGNKFCIVGSLWPCFMTVAGRLGVLGIWTCEYGHLLFA